MHLLFGDFVFDPERQLLRKNGALLKVDPQQLSLLSCLVTRPGHLLTREDILKQVWEGRAVTSSALSVAVAKLRKVLGGEGKQTYIENRYGRGYRFVMPVRRSDSAMELSLASDEPLASESIVGRAEISEQLLATLESCCTGQGSMAALIGEAGIGKTRLAESLEQAAQARGVRTAWARYSVAEGAPPLFPFLQALRELSLPDFVEEALASPRWQGNGQAQGNGVGPQLSAAGLGVAQLQEGNATMHRMLDQISQALARVSQEAPLLLIVDDVQWADAASLRLLAYLLNDLPRIHVFIVLALRAADLPASDPRHAELVRILSHRRCERHELTRLSEADVASYVRAQFGELAPELAQAVYARSEGNPFYMVELLRPFNGHSAPSADVLRFPGLALDAMRKRLSALPASSRVALSVAAVVGHDFDLGLLSRVTGESADHLLEELDSSLANETIVASAQAPGSFAFAHDLIREVLYSDLQASERCRLHLAVGQALEERRNAGMHVPSAELAHHFLAALPYGDLAYAIGHARAAASAAMRMAAHADARSLLMRALEATKCGQDAEPAILCALWLELALVERGMGHPQAKEHLQLGVRLARERQLGSLLAIAGQLLSPSPGLLARAEAAEVLEAALEALPATETAQRALTLTHLAWTPPNCMSQERVQALLSEAERLLRASDESPAFSEPRAAFREARLFFLGGPETHAEAEHIAQAIEHDLRARGELGHSTRALSLVDSRWLMATQRGDARAMQVHVDQHREALAPLHNVELDWHWQRFELVQCMNRGEFAGVADQIEQLRERAERLRLQARHTLWARDFGQLLFWTGDPSQLAPLVKPSLALATTDLPIGRSYKLRAMAEMGLLVEARSALASVTEAWLRGLPHDRDYLAVLAQLTVCVVALESREHAAALYELQKPFGHFYAASITFENLGSVHYFLGQLARVLGHTQAALQHLEAALEHNQRAGLAAHVVQTQVELARMLLRDDNVRAVSLLSAARKAAQQRGLAPLLRSIDTL